MATIVQSKDHKEWLDHLVTFMEGYGDEPIDQDAVETFMSSFPIPGADAGATPTEMITMFQERMASDPEYRNMIMDNKNREKFTKSVDLAAGIVTTGQEISDAKEQIREADKEAKTLQKPTAPSLLSKNPKLKAAMRRAELDLAGEGDAAFLSPYERQAQDQYTKDLAVAKTASTGQAGTFGALAQSASTRRMQGARELIPLMEQKRQTDKQSMKGLIGMDIAEDRAIKSQEMQRYGQNLGQYNVDRDLISKTGSYGRQNLAMGRRTMGQQVSEALGEPLYNALPMRNRGFLNPVADKFKQRLQKGTY